MIIYEFITPSDPITFKAENDKVAFVCAEFLGKGQAGCKNCDTGESLPSITMLIKDEEEFVDNFLDCKWDKFFHNNKPQIAAAFASFAYGSVSDRQTFDEACEFITDPEKLNEFKTKHENNNRSSMSQWVRWAWDYADMLFKQLNTKYLKTEEMSTARKMVKDWIDKNGYVVALRGDIQTTLNANDIVALIEGISGQGDNGTLLEVQKGIDNTPSDIRGGYSDGFHTFNELYEFRKVFNAALFNEWAEEKISNPKWKDNDGEPSHLPKFDVHKSWRHHDGELCFGGGWFIVVAILPSGQISNHYQAQDWDLFKIPAVEKAKYPFDGHTPADVLTRLKSL